MTLAFRVLARTARVLLAAAAVCSCARAGSPESSAARSQFVVGFDGGVLVSLRAATDPIQTDYLGAGREFGDVFLQFRSPGAVWRPVLTGIQGRAGNAVPGSPDGVRSASCFITNGLAAVLQMDTKFLVKEETLLWTVTLRNLTDQPLEIGDLALPLPIGNRRGPGGANASGPVILKHSYLSGQGSFIFWTRSNLEGPCLMMTPTGETSFEYWEAQPQAGGYRVYIHSAVAGAAAKARGTHWRQPNTSLVLAPRGQAGDSHSYGVQFRWAQDYDGVRQLLVDEGKIDVSVVPGMTVPSDLFAEVALRTTRKIDAVEAEFPEDTRIESLGARGDARRYKVRFGRLGENELTVRYGDHEHLVLEFFCTDPLETLIRKRAAFIARHQVRDPAKWYNGLFCDWNMESQVQVTPDNYDRLRGFRIYAATCDDAGLGHPAFLAAKNAEYPVPSEVEALDYYLQHFVWGGLQRTDQESYAYGVYGIPDWKKNRDSTDPGRNGRLHLYRVYDYPHVILLYFSMYLVAREHPEIRTALTASQYLRRAFGTAQAMFTVPHEVWNGWSAFDTGFYNERVLVDLIDALQANGWTQEATLLRGFWERKVKRFVQGDEDLFRSEYAFDSTGFESTEAIARYAMRHANPSGAPVDFGLRLAAARTFLDRQMAANLFCRGCIEPAYYYLGSDYRGSAGNAYTLSYMAQMGGWSVLDYALHFATNPTPYLRLGYASILSSWALVNSGTPASDYGYWYPGRANDGAAGGGFEPAPFGQTWLGQPHHRGSWYYACEIDLGFCGALRAAATVLADDPIFGQFCYGGEWEEKADGIEVLPRDGVRRRFHAMLNNSPFHLMIDADRFSARQPIRLKADLSEIRFELESDNAKAHFTRIQLSAPGGHYVLSNPREPLADFGLRSGEERSMEVLVSGARSVYVLTRMPKQHPK